MSSSAGSAPSPPAASSETPSTESSSLDDLACRVDRAVAAVQELDEPPRRAALELKRAVEAFHKEGLTLLIRKFRADDRGRELLVELAQNPAVYSLFAMHGLVRTDLPTRVAQVLETVRPYLQSHGGDVELVGVEGSVARVRLVGSCHGCSMSAVTLRTSVETALQEHVPEITEVEHVQEGPQPAFVPLSELRQGGSTAAVDDLERKGWHSGPPVASLEDGKPHRLDLEEASVVLLRLGDQIQAFRNECAHQGLPIDGGRVDPEDGTLTCPWHGFRFDGRTGECLTSPQAQLEPFPLRVEAGVVWVRPS